MQTKQPDYFLRCSTAVSKLLAGLLFSAALSAMAPWTALAAQYDVGLGQTFVNLQLLVSTGVLASGDTIVIHADDASANNIILSAANMSLTIRSADGSPKTVTQSVPAVHRGGFMSFTNAGYTNVSVFNVSDMVINGNTAQGIDTWTSTGQGGAVATASNITLLGQNVKFTGNIAQAGSGTQSGGQGGAVWAFNTLSLVGSNNIEFSGNQAIGGDRNNSGQGGAIYAANLDLSNVSNVTFAGNLAVGGSDAASVHNSGLGGAVGLATLDLTMDGATNVVFMGNAAIGGSGSASDSVYNSGLGGAVFLNYSPIGVRTITGATFVDNKASTLMNGEMSSGRGGAIFNSGVDLTLKAEAGGDIYFSGNTHNPGNTGAVPNSIYFGNIYTNADLATDFTVDVDAGALITMLDPMASQEDDLTSVNGTVMRDVSLAITKTGPGTWILGGHNDMRSATVWAINEGTLYLEVVNEQPAHLDLSHDTSASFTLASGAKLLINPFTQAHLISAREISLESGSGTGLWTGGEFSYFDLPVGAEVAMLSLRTSVDLVNDSTILNPDGSFISGAYEYAYGLYWRVNDDNSQDLVARITAKEIDDNTGESGGGSITSPGSIAAQKRLGQMITNRIIWNFDCFDDCQIIVRDGQEIYGADCTKTAKLWVSPSFSYIDKRGGSKYHIKDPGIGVGIDNCFDREFFLGIGVFGFWPEYRSRTTNVDAKSFDVVLYGGTMLPWDVELGLLAAFGRSWYDQERKVYGITLSSDYHANNWSFGANLGKRFVLDDNFFLRPFVAYEYMYMDVSSYRESYHQYALKVDAYDSNFHFLKAGTDLTLKNDYNDYLSGRIYYQGLYGDNRAKSNALFIMDEDSNRFALTGDRLDRDYLGLGLTASYNLDENVGVAGNVDVLLGGRTTGYYGSVNLFLKF